MSTKIKCSRCKYKLPKDVCGCPESKYYNQKTEPIGSCEHFVNNPAQELYVEALKELFDLDAKQNKQLAKEVIGNLEQALGLGLPEDDEIAARFFLGELYYQLTAEQPSNQELTRAIQEMERSVIIDSQGGYEFFLDPFNSSFLQTLACAYMKVSWRIKKEQGIDSAIAYIKQKLGLFNYLPNPPSMLLIELGELYKSKGETSDARTIFMRILERAEDPADERESEIRKFARSRIQEMESGKETKSGKEKRSGCFIATVVYEDENALEVEALRRFRDDLLARNRIGRTLIAIYYLVSPSVARLIKTSELSKKLVKAILLKPVLWVSQQSCGKQGKEIKNI
jgi:tetratricopeptide (TPR) repeat protein